MGEVIFVEGVPGSGKSTTAQFLARQLAFHGRPGRWIYEQEVPNPFVPEAPPAGAQTWEDATWGDFAEAHVARWETFGATLVSAPETLIVESFLLQRPLFTMLRRDVDVATIEALVRRFADAVAALDPTLVYLGHPDPERAWQEVMDKRGAGQRESALRRAEEWPFSRSRGLNGLDAVLAYWRAHAALCERLVASLPMRTHVIDVASGTWPARRAALCARLAIPPREPPLPKADALRPLTGRYRQVSSGDRDVTNAAREIAIEVDDGGLVLRGALWASNALLPVAGDLFDIEAWPIRVHFDRDDAGVARALRCEGPRLWWGDLDGLYAKEER